MIQAKEQIARRIGDFIQDENTDDFDTLARELFAFQYQHIGQVRLYFDSLGVTPETLPDISAIPPIGLNVFKETCFFAGEQAKITFQTSGTSGKGRGASCFDDIDIEVMDTSILQNCHNQLCADAQKTRFLMLVPSPNEAPDIIMAYGMNRIGKRWGVDPPLFAVRQGQFLAKEAVAYIQRAIADNMPITIIGGSFGFVNFIDAISENIQTMHLPAGSRLLDAGGFKGRSRELNRADFVELISRFFNVPRELCFNLYGLTELGSQFYSQGDGAKQPPHWTRVRVCHPLTLHDVAIGEQGVAVLYDLANISKPFVILTDDLAIRHHDGFELIGRASGSAPRGCSLSLEEMR